jgi:hypothetical protein
MFAPTNTFLNIHLFVYDAKNRGELDETKMFAASYSFRSIRGSRNGIRVR